MLCTVNCRDESPPCHHSTCKSIIPYHEVVESFINPLEPFVSGFAILLLLYYSIMVSSLCASRYVVMIFEVPVVFFTHVDAPECISLDRDVHVLRATYQAAVTR